MVLMIGKRCWLSSPTFDHSLACNSSPSEITRLRRFQNQNDGELGSEEDEVEIASTWTSRLPFNIVASAMADAG